MFTIHNRDCTCGCQTQNSQANTKLLNEAINQYEAALMAIQRGVDPKSVEPLIIEALQNIRSMPVMEGLSDNNDQ